MVAAAAAAAGAVAAALLWPAYSQLLGRFLRLLAAHGDEKKVSASSRLHPRCRAKAPLSSQTCAVAALPL